MNEDNDGVFWANNVERDEDYLEEPDTPEEIAEDNNGWEEETTGRWRCMDCDQTASLDARGRLICLNCDGVNE